MLAILLIFITRDCAIPRKLKNHFPEGEFQRNLAQSSRSLIETHNRNAQRRTITSVKITKNNGGKIARASCETREKMRLGP